MEMLSTVFVCCGSLIRIAVLLLLFPVLRYVSNALGNALSVRTTRHTGSLLAMFIFYSGCIFIAINILHECGFNVTALLGAAGIFGVAVGFASQTSISNIISGFFLLVEGPFAIGDTIKSGETFGVVEAIDLLATRVKTTDNKLIRIPNEMVLKQPLINLTHYPERRLEFIVSLPYVVGSEKIIDRFKNVILSVSACTAEEKVTVRVLKMDQLSYDSEIRLFLTIRVWVPTKDFLQAPSLFVAALKQASDSDGLKITVVQQN